MLTKNEIRALTVELNQKGVVALIRCDAGLPFDGKAAIKQVRKLGLVEKSSWSCTEDGRQVVAALSGVQYPARSCVGGGTKARTSRSSELKVAQARTSRRTMCRGCSKEIPKGDECVWIEDEGVFHLGCETEFVKN